MTMHRAPCLIAALLLAGAPSGCTRQVQIPAQDAARITSLRGVGDSIAVTTVRGKADVVDADFQELEVIPRRGAEVTERLEFRAPFRVEADQDELVVIDIPRCRGRSHGPACRTYVAAGRWSAPGDEEVTRIPLRDVRAVSIETPSPGRTVAAVAVVGVFVAAAVGGVALAVGLNGMDIQMDAPTY